MKKGPVSRTVIENYAKKIGVFFPETYIKLLSKYDYLWIDENCFDFTDYNGDKTDRDIAFLGYKEEVFGMGRIYDSYDEGNYGHPYTIVPFGYCGNGDYVCFDYKNGNTDPEIIVVYHDDYVEVKGEWRNAINFVAKTFDEFLDMLYEYTDDDDDDA
ncbi:MAG: SMI1/KNR4 family protein [Cardiobacteriaceae bacterium]|nr:SMI1/KNR4 family protein [Cardiobacteriaceae bacterium]